MSLLWYPEHIEQALSRRMREAQEARERAEAGTPTSRTLQSGRVMLEWIEPVELGEVTGWLDKNLKNVTLPLEKP